MIGPSNKVGQTAPTQQQAARLCGGTRPYVSRRCRFRQAERAAKAPGVPLNRAHHAPGRCRGATRPSRRAWSGAFQAFASGVRFPLAAPDNCQVAQVVEHSPVKGARPGSRPGLAARSHPSSSTGRATASKAAGCRFESYLRCQADPRLRSKARLGRWLGGEEKPQDQHGEVAQEAERWAHNPDVAGATPALATIRHGRRPTSTGIQDRGMPRRGDPSLRHQARQVDVRSTGRVALHPVVCGGVSLALFLGFRRATQQSGTVTGPLAWTKRMARRFTGFEPLALALKSTKRLTRRPRGASVKARVAPPAGGQAAGRTGPAGCCLFNRARRRPPPRTDCLLLVW